jgi:hypothetical protein
MPNSRWARIFGMLLGAIFVFIVFEVGCRIENATKPRYINQMDSCRFGCGAVDNVRLNVSEKGRLLRQ